MTKPLVLHSARAVLRPPTQADRAAIARLFAQGANPLLQLWWDDMNAEHLQELLDPPEDFFPFLIEVEEQLAGLVQYDLCTDPKYRHASMDIGLADEWQGQGLGREVLQCIITHLSGMGIHRIMIDPSAGNQRAIALYRSLGFDAVGIIPTADYAYARERWEDQLLMVRIDSSIVSESRPTRPARL